MAGNISNILETVNCPDCIVDGFKGELIALKFYANTNLGEKYCVVVYKENRDSFIITAFFTSKPETIKEGGVWWKMIGSLPGVTVPARTTRAFTYNYTINISSTIIMGLFGEGKIPDPYVGMLKGADIIAERGIWVVPAGVSVGIGVDKGIYKRGENAQVSVSVKNMQNISYNANASVKVYDPINALVFNQSFSLVLVANETKVQGITIPITEGLRDGTYLISVEVDKEGEKIGTNTGVIEVQNIRLGIVANLPSGINASGNTNISFAVTNSGIIDVANAPLRIMLKDMNNAVVWQETKQFNIGVGANTSVQFTIPSFNLSFGKYTMSYNIEYGAKT
ncbi:MAG: hypothetical protein AABY84_09965, partial [Candidatus Firestonebacteria bacterium]